MKKTAFYLFLLLSLAQIQCQRKLTAPEIIPTTVAKGPGGNFQLGGEILTWQSENNFIPVTNVNLYLFNSENYNDTLAHIYVNSTDGTFNISDLPKVNIDIIITSKHILPQKWYDFELKQHNQFGTFQVFRRDLQQEYSPVFWMITRFNGNMDEIESAVRKATCHIDTVIVKQQTDSGRKQKWFLLYSDDEQPIPEKLEKFIFLQSVLYLWGYADWHHLP